MGLPLPFATIRNHHAFLAVQNLSSFILRRLAHPDPASNFEMSPDLLGTIGRRDTHDSPIGSLELDVSKAMATGWQPQVSLDEGLRLALSNQDA
nr:hypothetical protein [Bradyrhizobium sp. NAS80.1]